MRVLILPKYAEAGPSSRYRFYQYLPFLQNQGWNIEVKPLLGNSYVRYLFHKTQLPFGEILSAYLNRFFTLLKKNKYDIIWIEQEAFPWIPPFIEKFLIDSKTKLVADYDDAFFHRYDMHKLLLVRILLGKKIDMVMGKAHFVLAGNNYLADRARINTRKRIEIFPTVVDTDKFVRKGSPSEEYFTVGWLGSPSTKKYLLLVKDALKEIYNLGNVKIVIVGAGDFSMQDLPLDCITWSEEKEVEEISKFDVGIMPLVDGPFEKGKCGLKLIQYLSCGIPVVGSPVGVNKEIIQHGKNGFRAETKDEWVHFLKLMMLDRDLRKKLGEEGRRFVLQNYSLKQNAMKLIDLFENLVHVAN